MLWTRSVTDDWHDARYEHHDPIRQWMALRRCDMMGMEEMIDMMMQSTYFAHTFFKMRCVFVDSNWSLTMLSPSPHHIIIIIIIISNSNTMTSKWKYNTSHLNGRSVVRAGRWPNISTPVAPIQSYQYSTIPWYDHIICYHQRHIIVVWLDNGAQSIDQPQYHPPNLCSAFIHHQPHAYTHAWLMVMDEWYHRIMQRERQVAACHSLVRWYSWWYYTHTNDVITRFNARWMMHEMSGRLDGQMTRLPIITPRHTKCINIIVQG